MKYQQVTFSVHVFLGPFVAIETPAMPAPGCTYGLFVGPLAHPHACIIDPTA